MSSMRSESLPKRIVEIPRRAPRIRRIAGVRMAEDGAADLATIFAVGISPVAVLKTLEPRMSAERVGAPTELLCVASRPERVVDVNVANPHLCQKSAQTIRFRCLVKHYCIA